jgi:hypothetical protein
MADDQAGRLTVEQWERAVLAARLAGARNWIGSVYDGTEVAGGRVLYTLHGHYLIRDMARLACEWHATNNHEGILTAYLLGYHPSKSWDEHDKIWK